MRELMAFSRLKNIFSRFNPLNSFKWNEPEDEIILPPSSKELLEKAIKNYPEFKYVILVVIYHLINTKGSHNEYLTVLSKNNKLITDLIKGNEEIVNIPVNVKLEGKNDNILVACHNHFFGAVIPSLNDICSAIKYNCQFMVIVSDTKIGIIVNIDLSYKKAFIDQFILFNAYIQLCVDFEKSHELDNLDLINLTSDERIKFENEIFDKFVGTNNKKFVDEFNVRFNKYNIYKIYIEL